MRILFAGSSPFSMPTLRALHNARAVCAVLTAPDTQAGRGMKYTSNCVASYATEHGISLLQPHTLRTEARAAVARHNPDTMVCAAYGKIFGPKFLALFSRGAINAHPSLLPRFRGPAPVPATILAGDTQTGVSIQTMSLDMDCGDILLQTRTTVRDDDTADTLLARLAEDSARAVCEVVTDLDKYYERAVKQNPAEAVYCTKITSSFGFLSWMENATAAVRIIRAFGGVAGHGGSARIGAKTRYADIVLKLWEAHVVDETARRAKPGAVLGCDDMHGLLIQAAPGIIGCTVLQRPGKKRLAWRDFVRGEPTLLQNCLW